MQKNRPGSAPNDPEETSSLEREDTLSSPTSAGDVHGDGTADRADRADRGDQAAYSTDAGAPADSAPNVAPEAEETAIVETGDVQGERAVEAGENADEGSSLERDGEEVIYVRRSAVRRRPKYGRFIGAGVLVGAVLAVVLAQIGEVVGGGEGIGYSRTDLVLVLGLTLVPLGALVGGAVAIGFDRRNRKQPPPGRGA